MPRAGEPRQDPAQPWGTGSRPNVFLIADGSSKQVGVGDLVPGRPVDVYGSQNAGTGCFDAETIIAFDEIAGPL